jgi:hypothetical protein
MKGTCSKEENNIESVYLCARTKRISLITLSSHITLSIILNMEIESLESLLDYPTFLEVVLF